MSKIEKILVVFFVFLFLISFVYAQVDARELAFDYSLFSGKFYELKEGQEKIEFEVYNGTYNICENEAKTIPILVVNKADIDNKYSLQAAGASWISLNVKEFSLPKKQSGAVFLDLNPGQDANGRYNAKVSALSSIGNTKKDLSIDINVEKCYALKLELETEEDKVCGGVKKQYNGEIINNGKRESDIELSIKGPNWVSIDENEFSVSPNDRESFELSADVPANAKGVFNVIVNAVVKNLLSIKSEKKLILEVVSKYDCYKADVIADGKIQNDYSNIYVPIKIRNSGVKQADYEISLEAPDWISIEPKKLTVNPEQLGNLNLNINPDADVKEGNYPIKINVKSDDIAYPKNIVVVLSKKQFLKETKSFFVFYQYYIYVILILAILLFIFRRQISNKIKTSYKNYRTRRARLKALEKARKARVARENASSRSAQLKKEIKLLEKAEFKPQKIKKYPSYILFAIGLIVVASLLYFSIYQFNFPVSKSFVKIYYLYFIAGILISLFIVFLIEFYKPLFKLLKKIK